jgi:hypothetical protein
MALAYALADVTRVFDLLGAKLINQSPIKQSNRDVQDIDIPSPGKPPSRLD